MPAYTANLLHQFTNSPIHQFTPIYQFTNLPIHQFTNSPIYSTAKNGATYPSINIRGTGQKKIVLAVTNPPPSFLFFCYEWVTSALYIICGQKVKLKPIRCLCFALTLALPKVIESKKTIKSCMKSPPWRGLFYLLGNLLLFNNLHLTFQIF